MTWYLKTGLLVLLAAMALDLSHHSPFTIKLSRFWKWISAVSIIILIAAVAWGPLYDQYLAESVGARYGDAFYPVAEARIASDGTGKMVSGFWLEYPFRNSCVVSPITLLLYLRIINLRNRESLITGYSLAVKDSDGRWQNLARLDPAGTAMIYPSQFGAIAYNVGQTINFPEGSFLTNISPDDRDFQHAFILQAEKLDDVTGAHPLESKKWVRGWVLFQYNGNANLMKELQLTLKDEFNENHTFDLREVTRYLNSDSMPHHATVSGLMDASKCTKSAWPPAHN